MPASKRTRSEKPIRPGASKIWPRGKITKSLVTERMVEKRARQLALIAGRRAGQVNNSDREEARRELLEPIHPTSRLSDKPFPAGSPWGAPPTSAGRRTKRIRPSASTRNGCAEGIKQGMDTDQDVRTRRGGLLFPLTRPVSVTCSSEFVTVEHEPQRWRAFLGFFIGCCKACKCNSLCRSS